MQINTTTEGSTTSQNAVDNLTKIFECKTPDGLKRVIPDRALLTMKLKDSAGDEISNDSKIVISARAVGKDYPAKIDETSYRPYGNKTIAEQVDNTKNEHMRLEIDNGGIRLPEGNTFEIWVNAPEQVDWTNSVIELNDVKERSM